MIAIIGLSEFIGKSDDDRSVGINQFCRCQLLKKLKERLKRQKRRESWILGTNLNVIEGRTARELRAALNLT